MCAIRKWKQLNKRDAFIVLQLHVPVLQFKFIYFHNVTTVSFIYGPSFHIENINCDDVRHISNCTNWIIHSSMASDSLKYFNFKYSL
jgi:hypothetical protein